MDSLVIAGLCLAAWACLVALLDRWCRRAPLHDLTRSGFSVDGQWHPAVCPTTRTRRNDLSLAHYLATAEQRGHRVRAVPVRPEPAQVMAWEDDGGTPA